MVARVLSVNVGQVRPIASKSGTSGIDKRPVPGPVDIVAPGPKGVGGSGLVGDAIVDTANHGGNDQAVYAYAREDLDWWEPMVGRPLTSGSFGENLTTELLDVTGALVGERWQIGDGPRLEVTSPRIPCGTFAVWLNDHGWVKTFRREARPGAYLRVISPGAVVAGDSIEIVHRPDHDVTMGLMFRALTTEPELMPRLAAAGDAIHEELRGRVPLADSEPG
ncbi:MAG: MOSC domain-containing protein [Acidimicrobiia bacterium]|nr:MOSC domain-containing protein [Acidimicrobiia bacterium]